MLAVYQRALIPGVHRKDNMPTMGNYRCGDCEGRIMAHREYVCGECGHRFGTPADAPHDTRSFMCPSCGSIDLTIVDKVRVPTAIMRAAEPAKAGDGWRGGGSG